MSANDQHLPNGEDQRKLGVQTFETRNLFDSKGNQHTPQVQWAEDTHIPGKGITDEEFIRLMKEAYPPSLNSNVNKEPELWEILFPRNLESNSLDIRKKRRYVAQNRRDPLVVASEDKEKELVPSERQLITHKLTVSLDNLAMLEGADSDRGEMNQAGLDTLASPENRRKRPADDEITFPRKRSAVEDEGDFPLTKSSSDNEVEGLAFGIEDWSSITSQCSSEKPIPSSPDQISGIYYDVPLENRSVEHGVPPELRVSPTRDAIPHDADGSSLFVDISYFGAIFREADLLAIGLNISEIEISPFSDREVNEKEIFPESENNEDTFDLEESSEDDQSIFLIGTLESNREVTDMSCAHPHPRLCSDENSNPNRSRSITELTSFFTDKSAGTLKKTQLRSSASQFNRVHSFYNHKTETSNAPIPTILKGNRSIN